MREAIVETIGQPLLVLETPAIALTGIASGVERQAMTAGFDICVNKPFAPQKLIELAASLVRRKRRQGIDFLPKQFPAYEYSDLRH